jgi:uroporphyrinogen-III synthase
MSEKQSPTQFSAPALLRGQRILICRPEPAASELSSALSAMGAECLSLPTLSIEAIEISAVDRQRIMNLDQYQQVIVVSQHAAKFGMDEIDTYWPQLPLAQEWFAIGRKTAASLQHAELDLTSPVHDLSSEKLLEHPAFKEIKGKKVLILKGKNGRDILQQELSKRGASVETVSLYERKRPIYPAEKITEALSQFSPKFIVALSGETLTNLIEYCRPLNIDLSSKSFILSSTRVANIAYEHGIKHSYIPNNLMPIDIIRCIKHAN